MERINKIRRSILVICGLYSMELFGMISDSIHTRGSRLRTRSDLESTEWNKRAVRMRSFSETPGEKLDVKNRKDQEVLDIQRIKIQSNNGYHRKQIEAYQTELKIRYKGELSDDKDILKIGDFRYEGELSDGKAIGKGRITHKNKIVRIDGWFYENFLDLNKKIEVTGANRSKIYVFEQSKEWINDSKYQQLISIKDITKVTRSLSYDGSLCLRFGGRKEGLVFNPKFVYKGVLVSDEMTGEGTMVKNKGIILTGKFYRGMYKGEK